MASDIIAPGALSKKSDRPLHSAEEALLRANLPKREEDYLPRLFSDRPNASRYNTDKSLIEFYAKGDGDRADGLREHIRDLQFNRKADGWEVLDGKFIWYEVDGTNRTTLQKLDELSSLADYARDLNLNLFLYDAKTNISYFFNHDDLSRLYADIMFLDMYLDLDFDMPFKKSLPCTKKVFGLDYSLLELAT